MKYFIVMNEWNYPNESGREYVGDYDTRQDAMNAAYNEYCDEEFNFLDNTDGDMYREACGQTYDEQFQQSGWEYNSFPNETENFFFRSVIIEREF